MGRRFIVLEDSALPREIVPEGENLEIGRAPELEIVLGDRSVSRRHALIRQQPGHATLEDSGSTHGTFVNEHSVRPGEPRPLKDGDVIRIGKVQVICRFDDAVADIEAASRDSIFAAQANARLITLEGEYTRRWPMSSASTLIGSAPHCEVRLQDRSSPPVAARVRAAAGQFWLEPRWAASLPFLNESQAPVSEPTVLATSSVFVVQKAQVLFLYDFDDAGNALHDPLAAAPRRAVLEHIATQCGVACDQLRALARSRRNLGRSFGEVLIEKGLVTPLFWRVVCSRFGESKRKQSSILHWLRRLPWVQ